MTEKRKEAPKVAIFVTGDKGGVGKSVVARVFAERLRSAQQTPGCSMHGKSVAILDADGKARSLRTYFPSKDGLNDPLGGVGWFDLDDEAEADNVLNAMATGADVLLFDVPGGGATKIAGNARDPEGFVEAFSSRGYDVAMVLVFTPFHDAVATCATTVGFYGARPGLRYYAVKNHPTDESLSLTAKTQKTLDWICYEPDLPGAEPLFDGFTGREIVESVAGRTFEYRALPTRHLLRLNRYGVGFQEAVETERGPLAGDFALRGSVSNWLRLAEAPLETILSDAGF